MQITWLLLSLFVKLSLSTPYIDLFNPFGDFLQGKYLQSKDDIRIKSMNFENYKKDFFVSLQSMQRNAKNDQAFIFLFKAKLEDQDQLNVYFIEFTKKFNKTYLNQTEANTRKQIFKNNLQKIFEHNVDAANGQSSFTQNVNRFADLTVDEIIRGVTGYFPTDPYEQTHNGSSTHGFVRKSMDDKSWEFDWRFDIETQVHNQVEYNQLEKSF